MHHSERLDLTDMIPMYPVTRNFRQLLLFMLHCAGRRIPRRDAHPVRSGSNPKLPNVYKNGFAQHGGSLQEITVEGDNKLKLDRVVGATGLIVGSFGSA